MKQKIRQGLKFINRSKKEWSYQISEIDEETVIVSWIERGNIKSTIYELQEVKNFFKTDTWLIVDPSTSVAHPDRLISEQTPEVCDATKAK